MSEIMTSTMVITPSKAQELLSRNTMNRSVKEAVVRRYADDMTRGFWKRNGETIKIANDGTILDGQHRLLAVIKSGVPLVTEVTTGLDKDSIYTIDCGSARSSSDSLKIEGVKNYRAVASVCTAFIMTFESDSLEPYFARNGRFLKPSTARVVSYYHDNKDRIDEASGYAKGFSNCGLVNVPTAALVFSIGSYVSSDDALFFLDKLNTGEGLSKGDPIFETRSTLARDKMSHAKRMPIRVRNALIIKAWNKFISGETVRCVSYRQGGANRESFPEMIGYDLQKVCYRNALPSNGLQ